MPHSHHSHSGQFCPGHARNTLEEMVRAALAARMSVFALTEHMPRHACDAYPEELPSNNDDSNNSSSTSSSNDTEKEATGAAAGLSTQWANHTAFYAEAVRLRDKYRGRIDVLVGFEGEWIGDLPLGRKSGVDGVEGDGAPAPPARSLELIAHTLGDAACSWDFFVGSIHHVGGTPIDYDQSMWDDARARVAGGLSVSDTTATASAEQRLFAAFFDQQHGLLTALRPPVVAHFDLIKLFASDATRHGRVSWPPPLWTRICRNLRAVRAYGGLLEINTSAWRKGLREPYPGRDITRHFVRELGGRVCFSDDAHGVDQVGTHYGQLRAFLHDIGVADVWFLRRGADDGADDRERTGAHDTGVLLDDRFPRLRAHRVHVNELLQHPFWDTGTGGGEGR